MSTPNFIEAKQDRVDNCSFFIYEGEVYTVSNKDDWKLLWDGTYLLECFSAIQIKFFSSSMPVVRLYLKDELEADRRIPYPKDHELFYSK